MNHRELIIRFRQSLVRIRLFLGCIERHSSYQGCIGKEEENVIQYTAYEVNAENHTWMVRRWQPPLTDEELAAYNAGEPIRSDKDLNSQYAEALISGPLTEKEAIDLAVKRGSWG